MGPPSTFQHRFRGFIETFVKSALKRHEETLSNGRTCVFRFQNNVLELWSLFDFLMPGFLGTEKQFQARFGKPILQSRDAKSSSKEQEAGVYTWNNLMLNQKGGKATMGYHPFVGRAR